MNWELLGHEWAVELLKGQIKRDKLRQAYLITGPQGVGRRTLALRLAQAVNCEVPSSAGVPCNQCRTCQRILRMQHPDLHLVQAEEIGGTLRVDQVRELQRSLVLAPYEARKRVAVLLRFEEANPSAANALLKMLEEPPINVILVLTAANIESLLETIVSRCEVIRLRPLSLPLVVQGLTENWSVEPEDARLLAHLSDGRVGYALYLDQNRDYLKMRTDWLDLHASLLSAGRVERFHYAENAAKDRGKLRQLLILWLSFWRDVLLAATSARVPLTNIDREVEIRRLAGVLSLAQVQALVKEIDDLIFALDANVNARLALEVLMLDLPEVAADQFLSSELKS